MRGKFDIDIAFLEGPITRIFGHNGNKRKITWIHNDISQVFGKGRKANLKRHIDKKIYKKYDKQTLTKKCKNLSDIINKLTIIIFIQI